MDFKPLMKLTYMKKNIYLWIQKYRRWEFWPGYIFDIPVYAYFLYLAIRARHLGFFSNINPEMTLSGFAGYGKHEDMDKFDAKLSPVTVFITEGHDEKHIEHEMKQHGIIYPCIAKPTLGRTGRDVNKIHDTKELKTYLNHVHEDILIQEFIDYPLEF
jgi:carbamoylphosphate synthase large subunit